MCHLFGGSLQAVVPDVLGPLCQRVHPDDATPAYLQRTSWLRCALTANSNTARSSLRPLNARHKLNVHGTSELIHSSQLQRSSTPLTSAAGRRGRQRYLFRLSSELRQYRRVVFNAGNRLCSLLDRVG